MRIKVSEPTNGSDMILKASAAKGSSSEACRTIGSSEPILTPLIAGTSVGAGRESTTASSSGWTPLFLKAETPHTGGSGERRVGKECRSRWSPDHLKKKAQR